MAQHLHNKKNNSIESNLANILARKACLPQIPSPPLSPPHINTNANLPRGQNPLSVQFAHVFADKHVSWLCQTWKNVRCALPKHGFLCVEEPDLHATESSAEVKCSHQGKLEALPAFERHILLFISKKPLLKGLIFLHADNNTLHCRCAHSVGPHVDCGNSDDAFTSSVGIFLQAYAKDGVNLAHRLMDGKWTRRRLHSLAFARLRGPPGMIWANAHLPERDFDETLEPQLYEELHESPLALLHRISVKAFKERIRHAVPEQQLEFPNKEMLDSVQDFFLYTEFEGRRVFEELDRDADGKLTMDDVKLAMQKMKLPADYARDFMQCRHQLWPTKAFGWSEFSSLIQEKEPVIIQLFNSLGVSKSGTVNRTHIKDSLKKAGLSATEANVSAMMKFLATDTGEHIKYGEFRRFMLLLPTEKLSTNPWSVWLKAATAGGVEPSSEDLQVSVLEYIASIPRTFQVPV